MNKETPLENKMSGFDTTRIQALADGIFAFAMTLLVLDLKDVAPARGEFWHLMHQLSQKLVYYAVSFLILGMFWTGHHAEFHYIKKTNRVHLWLNVFLLMTIATIPYSTSLLTAQANRLFAVVVYSVNITLTTAAYLLHWHYATSHNRLTVSRLPKSIIRDVKQRLIISNLLLVLALTLSFWNETISLSVYVLIQVYFIIKTTRTGTGVPINQD